EILITMGAQNALFLLTQLLVRSNTKVALEDPGYPDLRNMFELRSDDVRLVPVDNEGICVDQLGDADIVFVTPSHQFPTNVTMSLRRRRELLEWANENDALIIEDDYEYETNYQGEPTPALKHLDTNGRVLHVGSLSKSMMPGLRMGFVVAPTQVVEELRASRRLMLRHPPGNNQRVVALFLSLGGHDALINRLHRTYLKRWEVLSMALSDHFPGWSSVPAFGGTSFWVEGPQGFDTRLLMEEAKKEGVLIEPGDIFFGDAQGNRNYFRLGFSSISEDHIADGIKHLAAAAERVLGHAPAKAITNKRVTSVAAE
ncbi:MAG: PLP-dependent aminotransferase family protein, partial [Pseudomonadota bacterium]